MSAKHCIFYVDDDEDIRTIVEFALEDEDDMTLEICSSGAEALEKLRNAHPTLVLLDVMMPGMDGPTTLEKMRGMDHLHDTPVVFITAKVQAHELEQLKSCGAIDVIVKPFDPMQLAAQIRTFL